VNFFSQYISAVKKAGLALVVTYIVFTFCDQGLTHLMESNLRSPEGATSWVFLYGAAYLANSILFSTLMVLVAIFGMISEKNLASFMTRYFNQACIEVVRSWGKVLSWSFLFIIPGFIKYLQFLLVPFVVALHPSYDQGQVDALKASKAFFKKHWLAILLALTLFQVIWEAFSTAIFDSYSLIWQTPVSALLISVLEAFVFLLYMLVLFRIYSKSVREVKYESAV
jgi:hypothetical protein